MESKKVKEVVKLLDSTLRSMGKIKAMSSIMYERNEDKYPINFIWGIVEPSVKDTFKMICDVIKIIESKK